MGLGFTIDTCVKVARFGISSVASIIEDNLVEQMREHYCYIENEEYAPIKKTEHDYRAKRITAYLNLLERIVQKQMKKIKAEEFKSGDDIIKYFELLPECSPAKILFNKMVTEKDEERKLLMQEELRNKIVPGAIDINIMTKCDKINYSKDGKLLAPEYADAMSALRGFAKSNLSSSVIFSAGFNHRLYSYCELFNDFFVDENGNLKKKIILKVSDYRSALIQGKFFAKKGLWISEFRIESGLNCGGHVFPAEGMLLGPILEEFKMKRQELTTELFELCNEAIIAKGKIKLSNPLPLKITVQGGIGTANENNFILNYYNVDGTGWGSPFLLVPEVTNVDDETLQQLINAKKEDYYLSNASPLGVLFHNFKKSSSEKQRVERIKKGKPGSPCYRKYLSFNTEFTSKPICIASRQYQKLKIKQLHEQTSSLEEFKKGYELITEKECLCEGLSACALVKNKIIKPKQLKSVAICPGPNLAYFSEIFTLKEMVDHIYGRKNILNSLKRANIFINELNLYVDYFKNEIEKKLTVLTSQRMKYLNNFKTNLLGSIEYYYTIFPKIKNENEEYLQEMINHLITTKLIVEKIKI